MEFRRLREARGDRRVTVKDQRIAIRPRFQRYAAIEERRQRCRLAGENDIALLRRAALDIESAFPTRGG